MAQQDQSLGQRRLQGAERLAISIAANELEMAASRFAHVAAAVPRGDAEQDMLRARRDVLYAAAERYAAATRTREGAPSSPTNSSAVYRQSPPRHR